MNDRELTDDEIDAILWRVRKPAIAMVRVKNQTDPGTPGCWFGGKPTLPPNIDWPIYHNQRPQVSVPMHFLVQINLAYMPRVLGMPKLPTKGTLFVFVDPIFAPMGEDEVPNPPFQSGRGTKVIYVPTDTSIYTPRNPPSLPDYYNELESFSNEVINSGYRRMWYAGIKAADGLHRWAFDPVVIETLPYSHPGYDDSKKLLNKLVEFDDKLQQALSSIRDGYTQDGFRMMSIFGANQINEFPSVENLHSMRHHSPYAKCPPLTDSHIHLFRFESCNEVGFQNYDQMPLSFWIHDLDLQKENFDNVVVWESN